MKKRLTLNKLLEVSRRLFFKKGYLNTSMEDIAKACGIKKASIYHHVPSRRKLTEIIVKDLVANIKLDLARIKNCIDGYEQQKELASHVSNFFDDYLLICSIVAELKGSIPSLKNSALDVLLALRDLFSEDILVFNDCAFHEFCANLFKKYMGYQSKFDLAEFFITYL